jgi:hypothetical protein
VKEHRTRAPEIDIMAFEDLESDDKNAGLLLRHIFRAIVVAFPGADFRVEPHPDTNDIVFYVDPIDGARSVEVTETFLDADDGLSRAVYQLENLMSQLTKLGPGDVLRVSRTGCDLGLAEL